MAYDPVTYGELSWETLATYSGATAATVLIVRALAMVPWLRRVPPIAQAYVVALAIVIGADVFTLHPPATVSSITLGVIKAAMVAVTVIGANALLHLEKRDASD